jgi:hypothetical protein
MSTPMPRSARAAGSVSSTLAVVDGVVDADEVERLVAHDLRSSCSYCGSFVVVTPM